MITQEELEKYGDILPAAVYLSSFKSDKNDADREIAVMLKKVFEFKYSTSNIVIVDSYIDRAGSRLEWDRLLQDVRTRRYQVILHCDDLECISDLQDLDVLFLNVLG